MIASSTTMPIARMSANSVIRLMLKPSAAMAMKAPMMTIGMITAGAMTARQFCRKAMTTIITSANASNSVCRTAVIDCLMKPVVS